MSEENNAPVIIVQPTDQQVLRGDIVTFEIKVNGNVQNYEWQYLGTLGIGGGGFQDTWHTFANNRLLAGNAKLSFIAKNQNGWQIRCKVTTASDSIYSEIATLTINDIPFEEWKKGYTDPVSVSIKNTYFPSEMADEIRSLKALCQYGGKQASIQCIPSSGAVFYDYDGTILYSIFLDEFLLLESMPPNPKHSGLISQGWNWSLEDAKEYVSKYGHLCIGQMYITDDNSTRFYFHITELCRTMELNFSVDSSFTIDWGDGTINSLKSHTYEKDGNYIVSVHSSGKIRCSVVVSWSSFDNVDYYRATGISEELGVITDFFGTNNPACGLALQKIEFGNAELGWDAFVCCDNLRAVTLPRGISKIESGTFSDCRGLCGITIPDTVTEISVGAFWGCVHQISQYVSFPKSILALDERICSTMNGIVLATLPPLITSIPRLAFAYCKSLIYASMPDSVVSIGELAFFRCCSLPNISFPHELKTIGSSAFEECTSLRSVILPPSVTTIGEQVFCKCTALETAAIYGRITKLSSNMFKWCSRLRFVVLPDSLTAIERYAFGYCESLEEIIIPQKVESIGDFAFHGCNTLSRVIFLATTPPVCAQSTWQTVPDDCLIYVPAGCVELYRQAENYPSRFVYQEIGDRVQAYVERDSSDPNRLITALFEGEGVTVENDELIFTNIDPVVENDWLVFNN